VWLGGWGPTTLQRVVELGVGWIAPPGVAAERLGAGMGQLRTFAARNDLPVPPVMATVFDPTAELLDDLATAGVSRTLIGLTVAPEQESLLVLDHLATTAAGHLRSA
jgi:hypothetical protein